MRCLIAYATNSGGTYLAGQYIRDVLQEHGHEVVIKKAREVQAREVAELDVLIIGSPSWYVNDTEGQPHWDVESMFERFGQRDLSHLQCAVYGLGDNSYAYFCGAVDVIEGWLSQRRGALTLSSLRVNEFYFKPEKNHTMVTEWAHKLAGRLEPTKRGRRKQPEVVLDMTESEPKVITVSKRVLWGVFFGVIVGVLIDQVLYGLLVGGVIGLIITRKTKK